MYTENVKILSASLKPQVSAELSERQTEQCNN